MRTKLDELASIIRDLANGNQIADNMPTGLLRQIVDSTPACKEVVDECKQVLKARKFSLSSKEA